MAPNHIKNGCSLDRLSNLPCSVRDYILKLLPLCDVVRTSILSREWRYKWVTCPHLVFDHNLLVPLSKHHKPELVIYRTLVLHEGPIVKFLYYDVCHTSAIDIDCWLHLLSNHNIEDLTLTVNCVMPHHFYSFDHLKHLTLDGVVLETPHDFKGFNKLVELHLYDIISEPEQLSRFLSKCPTVEFLTILNWNETPWCFTIEAPNLKSFEFWGMVCLLHLHSTSLEELCIGYNCDIPEHYLNDLSGVEVDKGNLMRVFGELPSIKSLNLEKCVLQFMATVGIPKELENFNDLTDLTFDDIVFAETDVVILALCLIKSSPNLQWLNITCGDHSGMEEEYEAIEYVKAQQQECGVALEHLKSVEMKQFTGLECEMEFLKLLLQWATRLAKLEIKYGSDSAAFDDSMERKFQVLKELSSFPRASSHAMLIFG